MLKLKVRAVHSTMRELLRTEVSCPSLWSWGRSDHRPEPYPNPQPEEASSRPVEPHVISDSSSNIRVSASSTELRVVNAAIEFSGNHVKQQPEQESRVIRCKWTCCQCGGTNDYESDPRRTNSCGDCGHRVEGCANCVVYECAAHETTVWDTTTIRTTGVLHNGGTQNALHGVFPSPEAKEFQADDDPSVAIRSLLTAPTAKAHVANSAVAESNLTPGQHFDLPPSSLLIGDAPVRFPRMQKTGHSTILPIYIWICGRCDHVALISEHPNICPVNGHPRDYDIGCCTNPGDVRYSSMLVFLEEETEYARTTTPSSSTNSDNQFAEHLDREDLVSPELNLGQRRGGFEAENAAQDQSKQAQDSIDSLEANHLIQPEVPSELDAMFIVSDYSVCSPLRSSPDTSSSMYPDRPIRPLPRRSLRARLFPDQAETIDFSGGHSIDLETASDGAESMRLASSKGHHLSWTGSSIFSKSNKAQSTKPTTVDVDDNTGRPTTVTLYDYSRLEEKGINEAEDDLESVRSLPSDVLSETGTLPGGARYQHAAARYIVKVLVEDQDLVAMYEDAIQETSESKFVRNHEKLLHSLYLDLESGKRRMPSEVSAVRFLARKPRRVLISSILYDIVVPSDSGLREKLQLQLDMEQHGAFMISRWLADQDNAEPNPEAEIQRHNGLDSGSESEDEAQ
jgi:rubrerythrin